ncbi:MAG: SdrD B-like domain-containing protein [Caldilineaceae bacterium]
MGSRRSTTPPACAGQNNHGLDFGFTQPASGQVDILNIAPDEPLVSLGNRVWYDTNNDGTVNAGEQNVPNGVVVELYQDSDSSGDFSAGDSRVNSALTSGGYYLFTNLTPSSSDATRYLVIISDTNFLAGGLLYGYHSSDGAVTDNSNAADNDKDHGAVSGALGQAGGVVASGVTSLTVGTQPTGEANEGNDPIQSSSDANSNQTIDFGFYSLSVGNRAWIDDGGGNSANADNGQLDSGESGLDGVTVELLDSSNAVVSTTTTSNGGYYTFTGLISGTYSVRISGYPATYRSSTDTVNASAPTNADDDDNGPGAGTGTLTGQPFALAPGSATNGHRRRQRHRRHQQPASTLVSTKRRPALPSTSGWSVRPAAWRPWAMPWSMTW